jgi:hypothetical protein
MPAPIDITGQKFGRLTAIEVTREPGHRAWMCRCDCGGETIVRAALLTTGHSRSCGCQRKDTLRRMKTIHGGASRGRKARLWRIWAQMRDRCRNHNRPDSPRYADRGIRVCDEWLDFIAFREWADGNGYDDTLTIERIDNDGNYEPSNCRWAKRVEQTRNRSNTAFLMFRGEQISVAAAIELCGLPATTVRARLSRGWTPERALLEPKGRR